MYMQIFQHLEYSILSTLWSQAFYTKGGPFAVTADSCTLICKSLIVLIPSITFSSSLELDQRCICRTSSLMSPAIFFLFLDTGSHVAQAN